MTDTVMNGSKVTLHYRGTLEDGEEFDSSYNRDAPMDVTVGDGGLIKGFDDALLEMEAGGTKTITLAPEEAYGMVNPDAFTILEKSMFPEDFEFSEGLVVPLQGPDGGPFPAVITQVGDDNVTVDLNHPMAGKDLTFEIEVLSVDNSETNDETTSS